ncbi:Anoctamin protein, partial [Phytophthora megakarya]
TNDELEAGSETFNQRDQALDVAEHVNAGWRNYRNETPLFNAVLYLQDSAVYLFASILCPKSLAWELQNVNVEGSLLHHVSSELSRQTLGIDHQSARPEYVMLFDGEKKKQFKETLIETMHEESSIAPSLVVTRSGIRASRSKKQTDYLVIGTTDEVLIQQAQILELKRQQVIQSIIHRKINLQKHLKNGNIKLIFPLHDAMGCRNTLQQFFFERKRYQYEMLWPLLTYFGEKHAFYYAFVTFYTVWLLPIALMGVVCQLLWLADDVSFVPPLFAIVVSIWATLMVERWKRKLFWFKFVNAFISLFWIAFIDQNAAALRKQLLIIMGVEDGRV